MEAESCRGRKWQQAEQAHEQGNDAVSNSSFLAFESNRSSERFTPAFEFRICHLHPAVAVSAR